MNIVTAFRPDLLNGQTALVTGASSGIGAACARHLAAVGARVLLTARSEDRLNELAADLPRAHVLPSDLAKFGEAEALIERASEFGDIDILVNSAGFGVLGTGASMRETDLDAMWAVNVRAPMMLAGRLGASMAKRGRGSIITISSTLGHFGVPFEVGYTATKGAVDAFTRALARELGPDGVRVNAIAPGAVATDMWGGAQTDPGVIAAIADYISMRRWGQSEEIAEAVVYLASDAASYVTGDILCVDGGLGRTGDIAPRNFFDHLAGA